MTLPKTILDIIRVIQKRLEISPKNDKVLFFAPDEFRGEDYERIGKRDLKNALRKLSEDEKIIQLKDVQCLDRLGWRSGEKIELRINREGFEKFCKEHLRKHKASIGKVEFLDNESVLKLGDKKCALPPYKNEHFFCRAAFEHQINEPIDWSIIYEKMTGYYEEHFGKSKDTRENWHRVYDTMEAINKRTKEVLDIEKLFVWQEKTIRRTQ